LDNGGRSATFRPVLNHWKHYRVPSPRPRSRSRRRSKPSHPPQVQHRNLGRRSIDNHREWLLETYGPICAYCGEGMTVAAVTLDHVYPRKGQTAYDRADNLVVACRECNALKADTPFLSFITQRRSRGVFLLHYGEHISESVLDIVRKAIERPFLEAPANGMAPTGLGHRRGRPGMKRR
jgi:5-methylcytosine-specific restriction endonuclease McrA